MSERFVYKLLTAEDWARARETGLAEAAIDRADGYVHLSASAQVQETADLHFKGEAGCALLEFEADALSPLKWEASRGGQLFPHLYGPLEIARASRRWTLDLKPGAGPAIPEEVGA